MYKNQPLSNKRKLALLFINRWNFITGIKRYEIVLARYLNNKYESELF